MSQLTSQTNTVISWKNLTPTFMLGGTQYLKEQDLVKKESESVEQYITELYDLVEFFPMVF